MENKNINNKPKIIINQPCMYWSKVRPDVSEKGKERVRIRYRYKNYDHVTYVPLLPEKFDNLFLPLSNLIDWAISEIFKDIFGQDYEYNIDDVGGIQYCDIGDDSTLLLDPYESHWADGRPRFYKDNLRF